MPTLKDAIGTIDSKSNESVGGLDRHQDISALLGGRFRSTLTLLRGSIWGKPDENGLSSSPFQVELEG